MKAINLKPYTFYLLIILFLTMGMKCKKEETGIEALPPATQEGKNTFGCLVNGEAFTPKGSNLGGPILSSFYQFINRPSGTGFYFNISASNKQSELIKGISLNAENTIIAEGNKYILKGDKVFSSFSILKLDKTDKFSTTDLFRGELYISKFDESKQIVSGTFWFDALNEKGEKVEVREGRFDVKYVQ